MNASSFGTGGFGGQGAEAEHWMALEAGSDVEEVDMASEAWDAVESLVAAAGLLCLLLRLLEPAQGGRRKAKVELGETSTMHAVAAAAVEEVGMAHKGEAGRWLNVRWLGMAGGGGG